MMKTYKILVSFGDGKPKESTIRAKNGIEAQDLGFKEFPGARTIRVVSVLAIDLPPISLQQKAHPLFDEPPKVLTKVKAKKSSANGKIDNKDELIYEALRLRGAGLSFERIASQLEVNKSTVRSWLDGMELLVQM